jgi:hypothetical protein
MGEKSAQRTFAVGVLISLITHVGSATDWPPLVAPLTRSLVSVA